MDIWLQRIGRESTSYTDNGILINSGKFDDLDNEKAKSEITKNFGQKKVSYKLKDWVFSRQRYWGEPIPLVHCDKCGIVAVPEKDLPIKLPKVKFYEPTGTGESPLAAITSWVNTKCPKCKGRAKRETNTMPQWAGSSWYYLRYIDPKNKKSLVDKKKEKYWMKNGVDLYVGGTEHATRHLIYARFWHKFLFDIGVVSEKEPFKELKNQGMVLGSDNRKMSKRWSNVVNPDDVVKNVGADTLRVYEMFMGPFEQEIAWSTDNMVGSRRFLDKIWRIGQNIINKQSSSLSRVPNRSECVSRENFETLLNKTIKKVTEDILSFNFNTAISAFMILVNTIETRPNGSSGREVEITKKDYEIILKLLAPFAPHITEEIWANLGYKKSIHLEKWPEYNLKKIVSDKIMILVQINGKTRASFEMNPGSTQEEVEKVAFAREDVSKWLVGKELKKKLFIKERILSLITD
jgi:leucyl-tRNA synthetase